MTNDPDISPLLERLIANDASALGPLFDHFRPKLMRMINLRLDPRLTSRLDAEDVLQEAWNEAQRRIQYWTVDPSRSFYVWLRLIVGQTLVDAHRRHLGAQKRSAGLEISLNAPGGAMPASSQSLARHLLASRTSPSRAAMRAELASSLEDVMEQLDEIDREVLVLRHFEELTNNEVAEVLGLQKSAASNRYVRALMRLREKLERIPGFFDSHREN